MRRHRLTLGLLLSALPATAVGGDVSIGIEVLRRPMSIDAGSVVLADGPASGDVLTGDGVAFEYVPDGAEVGEFSFTATSGGELAFGEAQVDPVAGTFGLRLRVAHEVTDPSEPYLWRTYAATTGRLAWSGDGLSATVGLPAGDGTITLGEGPALAVLGGFADAEAAGAAYDALVQAAPDLVGRAIVPPPPAAQNLQAAPGGQAPQADSWWDGWGDTVTACVAGGIPGGLMGGTGGALAFGVGAPVGAVGGFAIGCISGAVAANVMDPDPTVYNPATSLPAGFLAGTFTTAAVIEIPAVLAVLAGKSPQPPNPQEGWAEQVDDYIEHYGPR